MFRVGRSSAAEFARLLEKARASELTYSPVGATSGADFPAGFRHDQSELRIGAADSFDRAKEGLLRWQAHTGAGATVYPGDAPSEGETVLVVIGFGPLRAIAPCRVVHVINEPDCFGFAYGTLPGHPERGEEAFVVERERDHVVFRITAFSRPADLLTRLGGPIARHVQVRFAQRYLQALARYVAGGAGN